MASLAMLQERHQRQESALAQQMALHNVNHLRAVFADLDDLHRKQSDALLGRCTKYHLHSLIFYCPRLFSIYSGCVSSGSQ
jgi:hypothetical protein